ncbi:MAG: hypothetical protein R2745_02040 [Vicinamibacterales bacterium]
MKKTPHVTTDLAPDMADALGARRAALLRRIAKRSGLPPEAVIDLALELIDVASARLAPSPISRQAVGLGAARWRNVDPAQRSEIMRRAVEARWAKHRKKGEDPGDAK